MLLELESSLVFGDLQMIKGKIIKDLGECFCVSILRILKTKVKNVTKKTE